MSFTLLNAGDCAYTKSGRMLYVLLDPASNKFLVITDGGEYFTTWMGNNFSEHAYARFCVEDPGRTDRGAA